MNLSDRFKKIVNFVPKNTIAGDIGTDHGYIPVYLIKNGISKKVIATDISQNSLNKIGDYVNSIGNIKEIDIRLGDGLDPIKPFEIDTVIIAGMGGLLIRDILKKNKEKSDSITHFIFQPNVASRELREYLYENNFEIIDESLAKEGERFYEIIYAKKGKDFVIKDIYYEVGKKLILNRDPLLQEFVNYKIEKIQNILKELKDQDSSKAKERYEELSKKILDLKEVLEKIESHRDS